MQLLPAFACRRATMPALTDPVSSPRHGPPGLRFQNRYWRHRAGRDQRSMLVRIGSLALGVVLAILGVLMLVLPGPGIVALALAGALFASESLRIARTLDRVELW